MRVVERTQQGFLLIITAELPNRVLLNQLAVKRVALLETGWAHAFGRTHRFEGVFRICDNKRAVFAAEETGSVKRLQFLFFAQIESLADVNECWHGGIFRSECAGDNRPDVRRGDCLRRGIPGVPLVLMAGVENEPEIPRRI